MDKRRLQVTVWRPPTIAAQSVATRPTGRPDRPGRDGPTVRGAAGGSRSTVAPEPATARAGAACELSRTAPRRPLRTPRYGGRRRPPSSPATSGPCCGTASSGRRGSWPTGGGTARARGPRGRLLGAVAGRRRHEVVLRAGAEPGHAPRDAVRAMTSSTPRSQRSPSGIIRSKASAVRTSPRVARIAASRQRVAGERAADPADVGVLERRCAPRSARRPRAVMPYVPTGMPPPIVLPMTSMSGSRPRARHAAGAGADRVRLVDDQDRAGAARELADPLEVAGLRQDDPDVRQRRLDEHRGDLPVGERALERVDIVERHDAGRERRVDRRAERCRGAATTPPVGVERRERLVDRAVVAVVVDDDLRSAGDMPRQADREPVRVGRGERELPATAGRSGGSAPRRRRRRPRSGACG